MSRLFVCLTSGCVALASSLACTDQSNPVAALPRASTLAAATVSYPFAPGVHVAAMPGLDATDHAIYALNDWGEFAGSASQAKGLPTLPMHYQTTRGLTVLESTYDAWAVGVNNSGQVVVWNNVSLGPPWSASVWDWFGNMRQLRLLSTYGLNTANGPWCLPSAINNHGEVAGTCVTDDADVQMATVWTPAGTPWALRVNGNGAFVEQVHAGVGLSDSGYVSGQLTDGTGFVFTPTQQLVVLSKYALNGASNWVEPLFVNNLGQAAGHALVPSNPSWCDDRAVAWLTGGAITDLGFCGDAEGITDDGIIVGTLWRQPTSSEAFNPEAVIWTAANGIQRLPGLEGGSAEDLDISTVGAINHRHQVVGVVWTHDGAPHFVLWTLPATISASPATVAAVH